MAYRGSYPHDADAEYRVTNYDGETLHFCRLCLEDYIVGMHLEMGVGDRAVIQKIANGPEVRY